MRSILAIVSAAFLSGCTMIGLGGGSAEAPPPPHLTRMAWIVGSAGAAIGQAQFQETPRGVLIRLEFSPNALPAVWHAAHIHQVGDCSDFAAGFMAAGAHEGLVGDVRHGLMNHLGPDAGDLTNIFTPPGGAPSGAELFSAQLTLAHLPLEGRHSLLDENGSALIIHANPDDHATLPSGPRIACAALTATP